MAEVLRLDGRPINWTNPQTATNRVMWSEKTMYGQKVTGSLRTIAHIDRLNRLAEMRFDSPLVIIQPPYNTSVAASAGTHDFDACFDWHIPGVDWWDQQRFGRANGGGGWYRPTGPNWSNHNHFFTLPPQRGNVRSDDFADGGFKVGIYVPGQLDDYYRHAFGLKDMHTTGSDKSWFPADIKATIFDLNAYIARRRS